MNIRIMSMSPLTRPSLSIEYALLGFLRRRPMHGYQIHRQLSDPAGLGLVWRLKQSQLYALLAKLEGEGYITARLRTQDARPPRKVFRLTRAGRDAFLDWVSSPVSHGRQIRLEFLAKFYFARQEGVEVGATLVERQQAACRSWLDAQQKQAEAVRGSQPYNWLVSQFRISQIKAMLAWLEICQQTLAMDRPIASLSTSSKGILLDQ